MEKERLKDRWVVKLTLGDLTYRLFLESDYPNIRCNRVQIWKGRELISEPEFEFSLLVCNRVENKEKDLNSKSKSNDF